MNLAQTTTAFTLDGYRIVQTKGVVRGIIVRSRSIFGTIGGSLQTLVGGNITLFTDLCERTRSDAFNQMLAHVACDIFNERHIAERPACRRTRPCWCVSRVDAPLRLCREVKRDLVLEILFPAIPIRRHRSRLTAPASSPGQSPR